ncbi:hypothetical protein BC628DRAFT_1336438 [Trametes gibbosa]|nr:hypothetical protein BC628DRAFT_1336438 [Trametes gibbosa]
MPRVDPAYPSFTLVLTAPQPRNPPTSRLPAYRAAHVGRYHPYARVVPGHCQDRLMNTVDYRYVEAPLWEEKEIDEEPLITDRDGGPNAAIDTAHSVDDVRHEHQIVQPSIDSKMELSRSKLVDTLTQQEVFMGLRRRYLTLQAVKSFLKAEHLKGA